MAWKPILEALQARRESIKSSYDEISLARQEIEKLKAEYAAHLQKIDEEARARLQESIEEGRRLAKEIQEKARADSQASFDKARENIEIEAAKARLTLRREIADLAIQVSERILKEKMSDREAQEQKVVSLIEELEKSL
jgi:F-type H+-transporting ATPase subunit b